MAPERPHVRRDNCCPPVCNAAQRFYLNVLEKTTSRYSYTVIAPYLKTYHCSPTALINTWVLHMLYSSLKATKMAKFVSGTLQTSPKTSELKLRMTEPSPTSYADGPFPTSLISHHYITLSTTTERFSRRRTLGSILQSAHFDTGYNHSLTFNKNG
jgi:hypothetical protein